MSRVLNSSIGPVRRFSKLRCLKKQRLDRSVEIYHGFHKVFKIYIPWWLILGISEASTVIAYNKRIHARWFKVIFWSPNVGGHVYNLWKGHLTVLKRVTLESPGKQTCGKQKNDKGFYKTRTTTLKITLGNETKARLFPKISTTKAKTTL